MAMPEPQPIIVAIPARNEEQRIAGCLAAIDEQRFAGARPGLAVVVLVNNTTDNTISRVHHFASASRLPVHIAECEFPPGHATAGHARATALDIAATLAKSDSTIIATTDADSCPLPDWLDRIATAIAAGVDAVAGIVTFDPREAGPTVCAIRADEARYSALQAEITARVDPLPHDPWPNHLWAWGANLAVTRGALRRCGGVPPVALAEDRAFAEALLRHDCLLRHDLGVRVVTSRRIDGRAPGGLADLLATYATDVSYPCDAALEPAHAAHRRALARRRLRRCHAEAFSGRSVAALARTIGAAPEHIIACWRDMLGASWHALEQATPTLKRRRLYPRALARETAIATRILRLLRPADARDTPPPLAAGLWHSIAAE